MSGDRFQRVFSGAPWEAEVGYCRAVRAGDHVYVTGTAPVAEGGGVHAPGDAYEQARRCFEIVVAALAGLGADISAVVRTRMFVTDVTAGASTAAPTARPSATTPRRPRWSRSGR